MVGRMRADYEYPAHLKPYEVLDAPMLAWADRAGEFVGSDADAEALTVTRLVNPGTYWMNSAEVRGLIQRHDEGMHGRRYYTISDAGRQRLAELR